MASLRGFSATFNPSAFATMSGPVIGCNSTQSFKAASSSRGLTSLMQQVASFWCPPCLALFFCWVKCIFHKNSFTIVKYKGIHLFLWNQGHFCHFHIHLGKFHCNRNPYN